MFRIFKTQDDRLLDPPCSIVPNHKVHQLIKWVCNILMVARNLSINVSIDEQIQGIQGQDILQALHSLQKGGRRFSV